MLKNSVPGNWVAAASQLRSCGSQPHSRTRRGSCWVDRVDGGHRGALRLHELAERGGGEEERADDVGDAVDPPADGIEVGRHRAQHEARRADHEQPGDRRVEARWSHGHLAGSLSTTCRSLHYRVARPAATHPHGVTRRGHAGGRTSGWRATPSSAAADPAAVPAAGAAGWARSAGSAEHRGDDERHDHGDDHLGGDRSPSVPISRVASSTEVRGSRSMAQHIAPMPMPMAARELHAGQPAERDAEHRPDEHRREDRAAAEGAQ